MQTGITTENLLDEQHLNRSLCRAVTKAAFSSQMFPAWTAARRHLLQKRFAEDVSHRVQAEIKACREALKNDVNKVVKAMKDCVDCLSKCYSGNHHDCSSKTYVCRNNRRYKFPFLPEVARGSLKISREDGVKLCKLLQPRTCEKTLRATRFSSSTQKAEAMNNAFKTTNPKHSSTYPRNGRFRDHSAIHMVNNGPGESIALKMSALGLKPGRACVSTLRQLQGVRNYCRLRGASLKLRMRRAQLRKKRYQLYEQQKLDGAGYIKDQLIPELSNDHTYSTI